METLDNDFKHRSQEEIKRIETLKIDSIDLVSYIKKARIGIIILLVVNLFATIYQAVEFSHGKDTFILLLIQVLATGVYLFSILAMYKKPKIALIAAFAVYILPQIFVLIVYPASIISLSTVVKIFVIYAFIKAIRFANEFEQLRNELAVFGEELTFQEIELNK